MKFKRRHGEFKQGCVLSTVLVRKCYQKVGILGTARTNRVPYCKVKPANSHEQRKERIVAPQRRIPVQVAGLQARFAVGIFGKP
jgi:hypothetical protein